MGNLHRSLPTPLAVVLFAAPSITLAISIAVTLAIFIASAPAHADVHPRRIYAQDGSVQSAGEVETVFDWTMDRCEDDQIPDLPTRVSR